MRILWPANYGAAFKRMQSQWPTRLGWLIGPSYWARPWPGLDYALDNDAYKAFKTGKSWNELEWMIMIDRVMGLPTKPLWAIVPDVVADRDRTLENWHRYAPHLDACGIKKAFAVQDGMGILDVPTDTQVVFVGGTTNWKWSTANLWCAYFPRVHIGRVRTKRLLTCHQLKCESCDGSGWFREGQSGKPVRFLESFLKGWLHIQSELNLSATRRTIKDLEELREKSSHEPTA